MPALNAAASPIAAISPPASTKSSTANAANSANSAAAQTDTPFASVLQKQMAASDSGAAQTPAQDATDTASPALLPDATELAQWVVANMMNGESAKVPLEQESGPVTAVTANLVDPQLALPALPGLPIPPVAIATISTTHPAAQILLTEDRASADTPTMSAMTSRAIEGKAGDDDFAALTEAFGTSARGAAPAIAEPRISSPAIVAVVPEFAAARLNPDQGLAGKIATPLPIPSDPNAATAAQATQAAQAALAQAAAQNQAITANAPRIDTPVGAAGWDGEIGNRIAWLANHQQGRAELVLTPPQMGRIEISLSMNGDQANALFVSANPAVRDALESALPRLREILAEAGITLTQAQVGSESSGQSANHRENSDNSPRGADAGFIGNSTATQHLAGPASNPWSSTGRSMVDIFA